MKGGSGGGSATGTLERLRESGFQTDVKPAGRTRGGDERGAPGEAPSYAAPSDAPAPSRGRRGARGAPRRPSTSESSRREVREIFLSDESAPTLTSRCDLEVRGACARVARRRGFRDGGETGGRRAKIARRGVPSRRRARNTSGSRRPIPLAACERCSSFVVEVSRRAARSSFLPICAPSRRARPATTRRPRPRRRG